MECPSQLHTSNFSTQFCIQMANQVLLKQIDKGSNFVLSPLSFHFMLSLIAAGSTGRTLEQLLSYLGSKSIGDLNFMSSQFIALTSMMSNVKGGKNKNNQISSPSLSFANGLWIDRRFSLNPSYERILKASYNAKAKEVDFANKADKVIVEVNSWVENETKGLIKDLLRPGSINGDTALLFANALYFKGKWDRKFDKKLTRNKKFHLLNGKTVRVPFMTSEKYEHHHLYGSFDGYKILSIPYQSSQFYMYFFLPNDTNGLPKLVKRLNSNPGFMNQEFELWEEEVPELWIPRFKFSFEFEASETIKEMGLELELPFMDVGELTEMVVDGGEGDELGGGLYLSKVFHKSCIEVNEEGTEAAASTADIIRFFSKRIPTPRFVADHPFMFMIREETSGTVLFTGAVLNPLLVA